ncbi:hypothetical protein Gotri_024984 [Gossypium trilobum]|uniref:TF-B3 domain-containing protein n=1 Tax=Gossypium trilobum TaxID=34281 RepID=A0A7J9FK72_9ROSI|nr:hypothetical protein [Gossypium trilobum]
MAPHSGIIFFKELTDTDVKKRLVVPKEYQDFFLPSYGRLPAKIKLMYDGKIWEVKCTVRTKGYLRPVLTVGWKMFVVANELKVGDRITMYKDEDGFSHYMVESDDLRSGTSDAGGIGEACPDITTDHHQDLSLDLVLRQPGTIPPPYVGEVKLDLTLAPPNVERADIFLLLCYFRNLETVGDIG